MGREVAALIAAASALALGAEPMGRDINPASLGANALPAYAVDGPWVAETWSADVGGALQTSSAAGGDDTSATVPFRLEYPFAGRATLLVQGSPFEWFRYAPVSLAAWEPSRGEGVTRADVTVGARFLVVPPEGRRPAVGLRALVKTATGEDLRNRRFLDAPAYQFDLTVGHVLQLPVGALEAVASAGFLAWQQGAAGQNDAFAWGARAGWQLSRWRVQLEGRGYRGWQRGDAQVVVALGVSWRLHERVELTAGASRTFQDPPAWDGRVGVRFSGPTVSW